MMKGTFRKNGFQQHPGQQFCLKRMSLWHRQFLRLWVWQLKTAIFQEDEFWWMWGSVGLTPWYANLGEKMKSTDCVREENLEYSERRIWTRSQKVYLANCKSQTAQICKLRLPLWESNLWSVHHEWALRGDQQSKKWWSTHGEGNLRLTECLP